MFSELQAEDLVRIAGHCEVVSCEKGRLLFREGDNYRGFYVVLEGGVKVYKMSPEGKETVLHIQFPQLKHLTAHDVRTRVIRYLLEEYDRQKRADSVLPLLILPISKTPLAAHIGSTLETLSRTLRKLEGEQLIRLKGKTVLLQNLDALRSIIPVFERGAGVYNDHGDLLWLDGVIFNLSQNRKEIGEED